MPPDGAKVILPLQDPPQLSFTTTGFGDIFAGLIIVVVSRAEQPITSVTNTVYVAVPHKALTETVPSPIGLPGVQL